MNTEAENLLLKIADRLETWADESKRGGWSTHQVEPQRELAREIYNYFGRKQARSYCGNSR